MTAHPTRIPRRSALALAAMAAACAGPPRPDEIALAAEAEIARRPTFYTDGEARTFQVWRDGRPRGLLWGTWHIGYSEATMMPRPVRQRFEAASGLTVEYVLDRVPAPTRQAMLDVLTQAYDRPDPAAIRRMDPTTRKGLSAAGVPAEALEMYSLLGLAHLVENPYQPWHPEALPQVGFVDLNLIGFARALDIPVHGLEEPDPAGMQALVLADPNGDAAAAALRLALRRNQAGPDLRRWLQDHFAAGRIGLFLAALAAWRAEPIDLARADQIRASLVATRNRAWMPRLEDRLAAPGDAFIAVGAAHLPGTEGLVALLRTRGWQVAACLADRCGAIEPR